MRFVLALALAAAPVLAGCTSADPLGPAPVRPDGQPTASTPEGVAAQQQRWQAAGLTRYTFTVERMCFCTPEFRGPFVVMVENGAVAGVRRLTGTGGASVPDTAAANRLRVDDLFALLADAHRTGAAEVRVSYDARLGYPTSLWIDRSAQMADEEIGYTVTALQLR